jgi:hypothetical protein
MTLSSRTTVDSSIVSNLGPVGPEGPVRPVIKKVGPAGPVGPGVIALKDICVFELKEVAPMAVALFGSWQITLPAFDPIDVALFGI